MPERLLILAAVVLCVSVASVLIRRALTKRRAILWIDPQDIDSRARIVVFTSPYCHGCQQWVEEFGRQQLNVATINIGERPESAARYGVNSTPRVVVVEDGGAVLGEFHHHTPRLSDLDEIRQLLAS